MKKVLLALLSFGIIAFSASAQRIHCTTDSHSDAYLQNHPEARQVREQLEEFTRQFAANRAQNRTASNPTIIIPVVFHILHEYGPENISDAQILDEMGYLNRDYNKLNPDTIDIIPDFVAIAANIGIEFRLAQIDPNGNCTNGIDRIYTHLTNSADDNSKLNPWPNNKYLNIWVAITLANSGAAAYAYYPGASSAAVDGVICRYDYVGGIETSSPGLGHTISHEVGHYFNLQHPWGSTNSPGVACGDDQVNDTPITKGWTTCVLNGSICNPPIIENVQNFMDYSYCDNMFTEGQKTRVLAAVNSSIGGRSNLWTNTNLTATGVLSPSLCAPEADFYYDRTMVCENGVVDFYDLSGNGTVTSRTWSFPGGNPSSSVDSTVSVTYPTAGVYSVTLTSGNATGTSSVTKNSIIFVNSTTAITPVPYYETFDTMSTFPNSDAFVANYDNGITWSRVTNTGYPAAGCIKISNYTNTVGETDDWVLPSFDFSNLNSPISCTFYVSNAQRNSSSADYLSMSASANCGANWQMRWNKSGASLATAGIVTANYTPTTGNAAQWRQETVTLNSFKFLPNVRLKFTNVSDRGNNTYIDSIRISGVPVGVDETDEIQLGFAIFPNPTYGASNIQFKLNKSDKIQVEVRDILGKTVAVLINEEMNSGMHTLSTPVLPKGIYMIDLVTGTKHHVRRLIVS